MNFVPRSIASAMLVLLLVTTLHSDTKGKIAGKVMHQDTGAPLADVEIRVLNTDLKTVTDGSGQYFILNLSPGIYSVQAFYLGYVPVIMQDVTVSAEYTTFVNFSLSATIIELGKAFSYSQEQPVIWKNETISTGRFSPPALGLRPMENVAQLLRYLPEIQSDPAGNFHIRGGRTHEMYFEIDGIPQNEPFMNRLTQDVLLPELHEVLVKTGAFEAEYGNASSGTLQMITRPLPQNYTGWLGFQTGDRLSFHSDIFTKEIKAFTGFDDWQIQAHFGGPVPKIKNKRLLFACNTRFWNDAGYLYGEDKYTTRGELKSDPLALVALNSQPRFDLTFNLEYTFRPNLTLAYKSYYQHQQWQTYNTVADHRQRYLADGKLWYYNQTNSHFLKLSHQLSRRVYYTLTTGYRWYKHWKQAFAEIDNPDYVWSGLKLLDLQDEFYTSGSDNYRYRENTNTLLTRFDLTAQLGFRHLVRTGLEYQHTDLSFHQYYLEPDRLDRDDNRDGLNGNVTANPDSLNDQYRQQPWKLGFYLQDKIEWQTVALNFGVRLDYFAAKAARVNTDWYPQADSTRLVPGKFTVSPRLSLGYNISEKGKFFANYGYFYQLPPLWALYSNAAPEFYTTRYLTQVGNPDLTPQQTISYEIGMEQQLPSQFFTRIKWFYRDFRNLLGRKIWVTPNGQIPYTVWSNTDFGFAQGMLIWIKKQFTKKMNLELDYIYQHTKMNSSEPDLADKITKAWFQKRATTLLYLADWEQPHIFQLHFYWSQPASWGLALHARIASGYPYTQQALDHLKDTAGYNSSQGPTQIDLDFSGFKTFPIWIGTHQTQLSFELKIYNLLDRLNEKIVWPSSGKSDRPTTTLPNRMSSAWMTRPFWYTPPREILLGMRYYF